MHCKRAVHSSMRHPLCLISLLLVPFPYLGKFLVLKCDILSPVGQRMEYLFSAKTLWLFVSSTKKTCLQNVAIKKPYFRCTTRIHPVARNNGNHAPILECL